MEISVPKQTTTFTFHDGRSHEVSLLAAFEANQRIGEKWKGSTTFEFVDEFAEWWKANAKMAGGVAEISRDEAFFLWDAIPIELHQQKKTQRLPLMSSTSTELIPSD